MVPRHSALLSTHFLSLTASRIGRSSTGTSIPKALHDLKLDIFGCIWGHLQTFAETLADVPDNYSYFGNLRRFLHFFASSRVEVWCFSWCPFESALLCLLNFLASLRPTSANRSTSRDWCEGQLWKVEPACTRTNNLGDPPNAPKAMRAYWSYYSYFRVLESHSAFCATTWCCVVKCTLPNVSLPPEVGRVFSNINHIFNIYNIYIHYTISLCIFEMFGNESKYSLHPSSCQQSDMRATSYRVASW